MTAPFKPLAFTLVLAGILAGCNSDSNSSTTNVVPDDVVGGGTVIPAGEDPFYADQWHLKNTAQFSGAVAGEDINVEPVWATGNKGEGVLVVIVDDGLQVNHKDLKANVAAGKSWDYNGRDTDPSPVRANYHGTNVAGILAGRDLNGEGIRGVAPRSSLAAYNLLWSKAGVSSVDVVDAMTRNVVEVAVSSNSWGLAIDGLGEAMPPYDYQWHDAVLDGVTRGRNGKGTVYVWAGGNGGYDDVDNSNYDYQANNRHVIAVCAVAADGKKATYSELGANLWLCAPSGDEIAINVGGSLFWRYIGMTTTDLIGDGGVNPLSGFDDYQNLNYTDNFSGTSASTPVVSGVVALMLAANPELGWRDVRLILAESARKNDVADSDWSLTTPVSGQPQYHVNHKYGFGVVDADAAVMLAQGWSNVGEQLVIEKTFTQAIDIPDNDGSFIEQTLNIGGVADDDLIIEYVEVDFSSDHMYAGELEIVLTGPQGMQSRLADAHGCTVNEFPQQILYGACFNNYDPWTFASARHLGESSVGDWMLRVTDKGDQQTGQLLSWTLRIYGRQL